MRSFVLISLCFLLEFSSYAGVIYVSSSKGNDENSGFVHDKPLKSIAKALTSADTVLLKSGDVFYENITLKKGLLSKYGGNKLPVICGYKRIVNPRWEKVGINLWRISLVDGNYSGFDTPGSTMNNNIGCLHEYDKDVLHGRKLKFKRELKEDWDIWQTEHHAKNETTAKDFDSLYLYLRLNPNLLHLEISSGATACVVSNAKIDGVRFEGFGFGISAGANTTIRNCEIDAMGGRTSISDGYVCYGNGIEFWISKGLKNCMVEECKIYRCYDAGCTIQGRVDSPRNIVFRNNIIVECCEAWEDFLTNEDTSIKFINCVFEGNIVVNSGNTSGFGYTKDRSKYCHVLGNNYLGNRGMVFRNNTFVGGNFLCAAKYDGAFKSNFWLNNTCYIRRGEWLLRCINKGNEWIKVPTEKGKFLSLDAATEDAIRRYRELTGDNSTKFVIMKNKRMDKRVNKLKKKYLR